MGDEALPLALRPGCRGTVKGTRWAPFPTPRLQPRRPPEPWAPSNN